MEPFLIRFAAPDDAAEGWTVTRWYVSPGDRVRTGQTLAELEGDKATVELPSPVDGVVLEIRYGQGAPIEGEAVLAVIETAKSTHDAAPDARTAASPVGMAVRVWGGCPECGARLAINGPHEAIPCPECGATSPVPPATWTMILESITKAHEFTRLSADPWSIVVRTDREDPTCHNCRRPLLLPPGDGPVRCVSCRLAHDRQPPPEWMRSALPWVCALLGTLPAPRRRTAKPEPLRCPSCGTQTSVAAEGPMVPRCTGCGADVRPPAANAPVPRRWYLLP